MNVICRLGRYIEPRIINISEAGQGFGEIALMTTNAERNASIIADEETDLLIINRDLFNRTVKVRSIFQGLSSCILKYDSGFVFC